MKTNKEFVKRIIATVQLKTLIILLKVQASVKLTDKEKDVQKEVNELIPEIYTDEDLKRIISELFLQKQDHILNFILKKNAHASAWTFS